MTDWKFIVEKWILGKHRAYDESEVRRFIKDIHGDVFVDVGANVGLYTLPLSKRFAKVYAFEPNPEYLSILKRRINKQHRSNITVYPIALSDKNGQTALYKGPLAGSSGSADTILPVFEYNPHVTPLNRQVFKGSDSVMVETATYDSVVKADADLVKIDVEGAEFMVLQGMHLSLESGNVSRLLVELHNQDRTNELEALLAGYGFSHIWADPDHLYAWQPP